MRNPYKILVRKPQGVMPYERPSIDGQISKWIIEK